MFFTQYMTGKDGSVMGVTNSRANMLCHCRTLTVACNYTEGVLLISPSAPHLFLRPFR